MTYYRHTNAPVPSAAVSSPARKNTRDRAVRAAPTSIDDDEFVTFHKLLGSFGVSMDLTDFASEGDKRDALLFHIRDLLVRTQAKLDATKDFRTIATEHQRARETAESEASRFRDVLDQRNELIKAVNQQLTDVNHQLTAANAKVSEANAQTTEVNDKYLKANNLLYKFSAFYRDIYNYSIAFAGYLKKSCSYIY